MNNLSLGFGDLFRYKEEIYVFLADAETGKYAARILAADLTKELEARQEQVAKYGSRIPLAQQIIFSYVILETPEYKDRACFHADGAKEHDGFELLIDNLHSSLNTTDKKKLKDDILKKPLNGELKDAVSKIKL